MGWAAGRRSSSGVMPPDGGGEAEGVEVSAADDLGLDALAAIVVSEVDGGWEAGGDAVEHGVVIAQVAEHGVGKAVVAPDVAGLRAGAGEVDEVGGVADGEEAEEDLVGDGED